jgi:hypothetical protein
LSATARKYDLAPSQICDLLAEPPRTALSRRMAEKLQYRMWELYEPTGESAGKESK